MRKGTVFIFTGEYPSEYYLDYLANKLQSNANKQIINSYRVIKLNGYNIHIMKYPDYKTRGYRPEFIYYIGNTLNKNNIDDCYRAIKQIESDTKILSTRKEPIKIHR